MNFPGRRIEQINITDMLIHASVQIGPSAPEQDLTVRKQVRVHRNIGQFDKLLPTAHLSAVHVLASLLLLSWFQVWAPQTENSGWSQYRFTSRREVGRAQRDPVPMRRSISPEEQLLPQPTVDIVDRS